MGQPDLTTDIQSLAEQHSGSRVAMAVEDPTSLLPSRPGYLRVVRASAWYDLVVTAGFATPWTYALVQAGLSSLSAAFGFHALPAVEPMQVLYANLMGSVVVVWALLRIVRPLPVHGLYDALARILFASWQVYALAQGATQLLWLFLVVEVAFGVVQLLPWWLGRLNRREGNRGNGFASV